MSTAGGKPAPTGVLGLGNAIVDVLARVDDAFLERHGLVKGSMALIDARAAEELYSQMGASVERSGGSAANTMAAVASLGGHAAYVGKVHDDALGRVFTDDIRASGVTFDTPHAKSGPPTARSMVLVTPDAQRTMQTYLGASAQLSIEDLDTEQVARAGIVFLEGYLWDPEPTRQAVLAAARIARQAGGRVALTLSDRFCVERHLDEFRSFLDQSVDVLFANEAEAMALTGATDLAGVVQRLRGRCSIVVVTRSAKGSLILSDDRTLEVQAEPVERVIDTTGAGDLYAGGFLFGLSEGRELATCGRIASIAAAEVIGHVGARPETPLHRLVTQWLA